MAVIRDKWTSSITITSVDGSELTLDRCAFEVSEEAPPEPKPSAPAGSFEFTLTATDVYYSRAFRHMLGMHTEPRNLGRSARQQDYRRGNSLARYYGRMYGETGLLEYDARSTE